MEFQVRKLSCVSGSGILLILRCWTNVVWVVSGPVVMLLGAQMRHHFATTCSIARSNNYSLVLTVSSSGWPSPFSNGIGVMMILPILRSIIDRLVSPVTRIESTLWTFVLLSWRLFGPCPGWSIRQMSRYWLYRGIVQPLHLLIPIIFTSGNNRLHH